MRRQDRWGRKREKDQRKGRKREEDGGRGRKEVGSKRKINGERPVHERWWSHVEVHVSGLSLSLSSRLKIGVSGLKVK